MGISFSLSPNLAGLLNPSSRNPSGHSDSVSFWKEVCGPTLWVVASLEERMKVILIENVPSLGKAGDVVQVAVGYGRNFLIPKKLALEATDENIHHLERQREFFLEKVGKEKQKAKDVAEKIENLLCTLTHPAGENEKLFGSITSMDLQEFLNGQGFSVDRRKILLPNPIKTLGSFTVPVKLHPEVSAQLKVNVVPAVADKAKP